MKLKCSISNLVRTTSICVKMAGIRCSLLCFVEHSYQKERNLDKWLCENQKQEGVQIVSQAKGKVYLLKYLSVHVLSLYQFVYSQEFPNGKGP